VPQAGGGSVPTRTTRSARAAQPARPMIAPSVASRPQRGFACYKHRLFQSTSHFGRQRMLRISDTPLDEYYAGFEFCDVTDRPGSRLSLM
jgi:hypothetical protein